MTKGAWLSFRFSLKVEREKQSETQLDLVSSYLLYNAVNARPYATLFYVVSVHEFTGAPYLYESMYIYTKRMNIHRQSTKNFNGLKEKLCHITIPILIWDSCISS